MNPGEWERDLAEAERRIGNRRGAERRRRDRWERRVNRAALLALVVLYVLGFASSDSQRAALRREAHELARAKVGQGELRDALVNACERTNVLRAQSNLSNSVSFTILTLSARREFSLARTDIPTTRRAHLTSARLLAGEATKLSITATTDCPRAVGLGAGYRFPLARPLGNPYTGRVDAAVRSVLRESSSVLARGSVRLGG